MRLVGRTVVTTRDEPGRLDAMLADEGAEVVHVPLIEIVDPVDGGDALADALASLDRAAWLIVTSKHGARRCVAAAAAHPHVRLATVGTVTAEALAAGTGRPVDVVPDRQTAADLLLAMPLPAVSGERVVLAQADRADGLLAEGLADLGYDVTAVTAYATRLRVPSAAERAAALSADAVTFASGSAALAWAEAIGVDLPPVAVAIGPTTAAAADQVSLKITHEAADHSIEGLLSAVVWALVEPA